MAPAQPLFGIDDIVYLLASARRGFLESYRIDNVIYEPKDGTWVYLINVKRSPIAGQTVGHFRDLRIHGSLYFSEAELIDYCTAVETALLYHQRMVATFQAKLDARCTGGTNGTG